MTSGQPEAMVPVEFRATLDGGRTWEETGDDSRHIASREDYEPLTSMERPEQR